jgi:hypothetical protein
MALIVAACGRQVTPNPPGLGAGGAPPGFMSITFDVAGQLNFSSYQYWLVFNTTGTNGQTPSTQPQFNNWAGYSYAIEVGGTAGVGTYANAYQFVRNANPVIPPYAYPLIVPPTLLQYNANSNGAGTEFTVIFSRSIFKGIFASASPSPTASPTPTTRPSGVPSSTPSPSPPPAAQLWLFNAFTTQANTQNQWQFIDSMGVGGPTNPQFVSPTLNVSQSFDNPYYATFSGTQMDPAAQITQITLGNNP